jgi:hypothetical protein
MRKLKSPTNQTTRPLRPHASTTIWMLTFLFLVTPFVAAHQLKRRPPRAKPPVLKDSDFDGVFFADVKKQLQGDRPSAASMASSSGTPATQPGDPGGTPSPTGTPAASGSDNAGSGDYAWATRMSAESIEAFVKGAKTNLDKVVSTPAKFASGDYEESRREFTLLALMFTVIEKYPSDIRWKKSAAVARQRFVKAAAASKVGSSQAFQEAKNTLQDLGDMLNGGQMPGEAASNEDENWGDAIDRSIAMQIMEHSLREHLLTGISNASEFADKSEQLKQHVEFLALAGEVLKLPGMPSADDKEYVQWCDQMVQNALAVSEAIESKQLDGARSGVGLIDQTCNKCHEGYR